MSKFKLDKRKLKGAINKAFDETVEVLSESFDDAITEERYYWPRETVRRSGEIARSPRNIVDSRELLESKIVARSSSENAAEFRWDAPHSLYVHEDTTLQSGTEMPGRPWTRVGLEIARPKKVFKRKLKKRL